MKKYALIALAALMLVACTKNAEDDKANTETDPGTNPGTQTEQPRDYNLNGYAQKGQFVKGSQVTAFAVGEDLTATGESYPTNISDDLGAFSICGKTKAPYFELRAEGYYFNELTGNISANPLYLEAFVKSEDSAANINLLTTAIRPRVKKLIKSGKTYDEAVSQAQNELLTAVGFTGNAADFDDMDITGTRDADGMLLAFASMVQSNRNASEVFTFIQEIASDIEDDGQLTSIVFDKYKSKLEYVNPFSIIENLANYYAEKKLAVTTVPAFYRYLDAKYNQEFILNPGSIEAYPEPTNPNPDDPFFGKESGEIKTTINVLSTINFTVESDVQGVTLEKTNILGPAYRISVTIPANTVFDGRYIHVIFKDASGKELERQEFIQGGDIEYLVIYSGAQTKSDITISDGSGDDNPFVEGAVVSVNGIECELQKLPSPYTNVGLGVIVHKAKYYAVSYPANAVEVSFDTDYYGTGTGIKLKVSNAPVCDSGVDGMVYFGGYDTRASMLSNPPMARMNPVFAKVMIDLLYIEGGWDYLDIQPIADNEYMAGTATYTPWNYEYDGLYSVSLEFGEDKSKSIRIKCPETGTWTAAVFNAFPQDLTQGFRATLYNKNGQVVSDEVFDAVSFKTGYHYRYVLQPLPVPSAQPNWLELPTYTEDDFHMMLIHNQTGGRYKSQEEDYMRNWSGFWDRNEHLCRWVAYPLNSVLIGSGNNTQQWGYDPLISSQEQPNLLNGSYGGGWTRGQHIPGSNRKNLAANVSTYYSTNIVPEQQAFHDGIMSYLRSAVTSISKSCDTLYVVAGCLIENSSTYTGIASGFSVKVPTHYYRALLSKKGDEYKAIGFLLPHNADIANDNYWDYKKTIDELEQATGMDFFPNLKKIIGETAAEDIEKVIGEW